MYLNQFLQKVVTNGSKRSVGKAAEGNKGSNTYLIELVHKQNVSQQTNPQKMAKQNDAQL